MVLFQSSFVILSSSHDSLKQFLVFKNLYIQTNVRNKFLKLVSAVFIKFLFFTKGQLFKNFKKCFLFHLKSSFRSRNIQILYFGLPLFFFLSVIPLGVRLSGELTMSGQLMFLESYGNCDVTITVTLLLRRHKIISHYDF